MRSTRRYVTTRQLAEALGIAPTTVRSWVARGRVGATRVGGRLRFDLQEVERLQVREIVPAQEAVAAAGGRVQE